VGERPKQKQTNKKKQQQENNPAGQNNVPRVVKNTVSSLLLVFEGAFFYPERGFDMDMCRFSLPLRAKSVCSLFTCLRELRKSAVPLSEVFLWRKFCLQVIFDAKMEPDSVRQTDLVYVSVRACVCVCATK